LCFNSLDTFPFLDKELIKIHIHMIQDLLRLVT
jgi:hypothetical protein